MSWFHTLMGAAGGGDAGPQVLSIASFNSILQQSFVPAGNVTGYAFILYKRTAGGAVSSIIPTINNWRRQHDTHVTTDGPQFTINSFVVIVNNVAVPATRGGDAGPWVVPAGANDFQFDPIPANAFGYSETGIPSRTIVKFKQVRTLNAPGDSIQSQYLYLRTGQSGQNSIYYNPANTTVTNPSDINDFTTTGTAPTVTSNICFDTQMLGTYVNAPGKVWIGYGDSIKEGISSNTFGVDGLGWFQRVMTTNDCSCINMGVGGSFATDPLIDPREMYWTRYANRSTVYYANNDFGTSGSDITASAMATRMTNVKNAILTTPQSKVTKVVACKPCRRTSSTDGYLTEANQTVVSAGWGAGGNVAVYAGLIDGLGFDAVLEFTDTFGTTDPYVWKGNNPKLGNDTVGHPANQGHIVMAAQAAPILAAV